jgi:hypothetical protein
MPLNASDARIEQMEFELIEQKRLNVVLADKFAEVCEKLQRMIDTQHRDRPKCAAVRRKAKL